MIEAGSPVPAVNVFAVTPEGPQKADLAQLMANGRCVLFGVPGAYTPTCSAAHVPGFREKASELAKSGVANVFCISTNDPFVMEAWGNDQDVGDTMVMLSDGNADFAEAAGLVLDGSSAGMGKRLQRFVMVTMDGKIEQIAVEAPGAFEVSSAEAVLAMLNN